MSKIQIVGLFLVSALSGPSLCLAEVDLQSNYDRLLQEATAEPDLHPSIYTGSDLEALQWGLWHNKPAGEIAILDTDVARDAIRADYRDLLFKLYRRSPVDELRHSIQGKQDVQAAFIAAIIFGAPEETVRQLIGLGGNPYRASATTLPITHAMFNAIHRGHFAALSGILSSGFDPNFRLSRNHSNALESLLWQILFECHGWSDTEVLNARQAAELLFAHGANADSVAHKEEVRTIRDVLENYHQDGPFAEDPEGQTVVLQILIAHPKLTHL